jgi:periplasmic protein TonB
MESNKILSADLLDLIFDDRNKEYGAYELRKTYNRRISKSLIFTFTIAGLALGGAVLARNLKPGKDNRLRYTSVEIIDIPPIVEPEEIIPPERLPEPEPTRTEQFSPPLIVDDSQVDEPPPTQDDLAIADIALDDREGKDDQGLSEPTPGPIDNNTGIIEDKKDPEPDIYVNVQVEARYAGNWEKFLLRNLDANVPVDNGAPEGRYTVTIQFVVDKDGNVSDLKALSNVGYGMEQEAIRVLKKAEKWEPAIQSGYKVKAFRVQRITFEVPGE